MKNKYLFLFFLKLFLHFLIKHYIMKKILFTVLFALLILNVTMAEPVTQKKASEIAQKFYKYKTAGKKSVEIKNIVSTKMNGIKTFYTINFNEVGFVIISADDRIQPILAYSISNSAPSEINNNEIKLWLNNYSKQIVFAVKNKSFFTNIKNEWLAIENETLKESGKDVSPLLTTTWDQGGAYNDYCPSNTPVGCVATATAQIMNFWEFPATGVGEHHYTDPDFGLLSADFSAGNYDWANMPDNSGNNAVAMLMYHCGISADMDYDAGGSGAQIYDAAMALANYFKYDQTTLTFEARSAYSDVNWINLIKSELDLSRPVLYAGFSDASGGHAFVFDGYNSSDQFHVNWGWSGSYNGYFSIGSLSPGGADFNDSNQIVIGIQPSAAGEEKVYMLRQFSGFTNTSEYPGYIDGVDENVAWATGRDGSGDGQKFTDFTRTVNGGVDWSGATISTDADEFSMIFGLNADTAFVSAYGNGSKNHVLRTYDGGITWTPILDGAGSTSFFNVVHFFNENDGFSQGDPEGGEYELYTTTDGGDNWSRVDGANIPNPLSGEYGIVGYYTAVGNYIWYTTNMGRVYYSSDKGVTWNVSTIYSGSYTTNIEIAFDDNALNGIALVSISNGAAHIGDEYYQTTDGGVTWSQITPAGNAYYGGISSVPGKDNTFISVGSDYQTPHMGISLSTDGGQTWINAPGYYQAVQMIGIDFVNSNKGYIGTFCEEYTGGIYEGRMFDLIYADYSQKDAANNTNYFCTNSDVTFTNESSGEADSYSWDFGTDATPPTGTGIGPFNVQYSSEGTKTITLTVNNSGNGDNDIYSEDIIVTGVTPADIDTIYGAINHNLTTETYNVDNQSNVIFNWSLSSANWEGSSTTNTIEVTFNQGDVGTVSTYAKNGCGEGAAFTLNITSTVGIEDIISHTAIYPNPATDYIIVTDLNNRNIEILDISGKLILTKKINSDRYKLNISSLKPGSYILKLSENNKITSTILIIQ